MFILFVFICLFLQEVHIHCHHAAKKTTWLPTTPEEPGTDGVQDSASDTD